MVNFHNVNDYALAPEVWQFNQITKPDWRDMPNQPWTYAYKGDPEQPPLATGFWKGREDGNTEDEDVTLQLGDRVDVRDRYEIMAFRRRSALQSARRHKTPGVSGTSEFNLQRIWPQDDSPQALRRHGITALTNGTSAEFRSTNMRQKNYWQTLAEASGFDIKTLSLP
jgi:hypothetical protein